MKKLMLTACICFVVCMSGCATSGSGCCGNNGSSIFGQGPFQNRPVRTYFQSLFQGDPCNTCNPPVGMSTNYNSNVAPLCDACGSSVPTQQSFGTPINQGVPLYSDPALNTPTTATMNYPNLSDPVIGNGVNLGTPTGSIDANYGEIPMEGLTPPIGF